MSNRALCTASLLIGLAGLWACWCDVALLWDGAYQLCCTLTSGVPFAYLSRFHSGIVWQPVAWIASSSDNLRLIKMAFGLPFCLAPLASVLLCWWIVHRTASHLMIWSLLGAALAPLPGQIFMINDSIFQMHLFWPVFFAALLPVSRAQAIVIGLVSLFQLSHPIGIGLCGLCAVAAAFQAWRRPAAERLSCQAWAGWLLVLALGGVAKLLHWPDDYAAREATPGQVWMTFRWGVLWWPAAGIVTAWLAALLLLRSRTQHEANSQRLSHAALALLTFTGIFWLYWASDSSVWQTAANYRRWLVPLSLPFFLAAGWEIWHLNRETVPLPVWPGRDRLGMSVALIFALVLGWQALQWSHLLQRLTVEIAAHPDSTLAEESLTWIRETPMHHWGLGAQVFLCQGRTPHLMLSNPETEAAIREEPQRIALSPFNYLTPAKLTADWFRWSLLLQAERPEPPGGSLSPPSPLENRP